MTHIVYFFDDLKEEQKLKFIDQRLEGEGKKQIIVSHCLTKSQLC